MTVEDLDIEGLEARASSLGGVVTVRLEGSAEARCAKAFSAFVQSVHDEAKRQRAHEVSVDLISLEFFSSACFNAIVTWIIKRQGDAEAEYRVRFKSSASKPWQSKSLKALSCFSVDMTFVEA